GEAGWRVGISVGEIAGGMYAYSGILCALFARATTGRGAAIDVSLFDSLGEWMGAPIYHAAYAEPLKRTAANHASIAPYGPFRTSDREEIMIAIQNAREWRRFCLEVLEHRSLADDDRFATNADRVRNRNALQITLESILGTRSTRDLIARLDASRIAYGRVNDVRGFIDHPQIAARDCWREVASPGGDVRALLPPVRMRGVAPVMG